MSQHHAIRIELFSQQVQAYLRDVVGLAPDHGDKANTA